MSAHQWCQHHVLFGTDHLCRKGHDVAAQCGGRSAIRFKMPCTDDRAEGYEKLPCADRLLPSDIIAARAKAVREGRELPL
jgi:hypothetical protein